MGQEEYGISKNAIEDLKNRDSLTAVFNKYLGQETQAEACMAQMEAKSEDNCFIMIIQQPPQKAYFQNQPPPPPPMG